MQGEGRGGGRGGFGSLFPQGGAGHSQSGHRIRIRIRIRIRPVLLWECLVCGEGQERGGGCSQDSHFSILTATFIVA